ncbi:hypothetical protein MYP_3759 [Sporocytophaga myxococcoides]|uniref:DUF1440 domain-containing protein n=1 Tax=Sporocytophaga myxococcoides TaxID=153721 RepID=A0A098LJ86_9BACT|nr:hypothetical protein [Sporocytophaga myxococcoides]GAL86529.1 hypothetical protein MYP_3759 [Sporocytophaga myxococcoides]
MIRIFKRKKKSLKDTAVHSVGTFTGDVGRGLFAGLVGTFAMSLSQFIEMKITQREGSDSPLKAAEKVFDIHADNEEAKSKLLNIIHYAYGTSWGGFRGIIGTLGLKGIPANALHFSSVFGTELVMLPGLKVAPPVKEWGTKEISVSGIHHIIYVLVSGVVFDLLKSDRKPV